MMSDPKQLIGKQIPAADGGDYGHAVLAYDEENNDLIVSPICWSTGEPIDGDKPRRLDLFKASYRYMFDKAR
jgi:hypothetical protein